MVRVSSPPQSRSKAVVCVSTPRMYPRSGYFLVLYKQILVSIVLASNMIDPLKGGWGYLIVMCAILVAVINQGLQLSTSLMAAIADRSFHIKGPQFGVYSGGKVHTSEIKSNHMNRDLCCRTAYFRIGIS